MYNLIRFFKLYKSLIFFLFFLFISLSLLISNNSYHKHKKNEIDNIIRGFVYSKINLVKNYFTLAEKNQILIKENEKLTNQIYRYKKDNKLIVTEVKNNYVYTSAKVLKNSVFKRNNFIIIDKGYEDNIKVGQGIVVQNGIVGIVKSMSKKYSLAISVLNKKTNISVKFKKNNYVGTLKWNGFNYLKAEVVDVMNHINVQIGDTLVTSGHGTIFPKDINIGVVSKVKNKDQGYQKIEIKFIKDLNRINNVYVVEFENKNEIDKLILKNDY